MLLVVATSGVITGDEHAVDDKSSITRSERSEATMHGCR